MATTVRTTTHQFVWVNAKGQYLKIFEVSSHSVHRVFESMWVDRLDEATLCSELALSRVKWKDPTRNPMHQEIVGQLQAEETRTVRLIPEDESVN